MSEQDMPTAPQPSAADAGAEAAARTFRQSRRRPEVLPWRAEGPEQDAQRRALLEHLAEGAEGPRRAQLLLAAAELAQAAEADDHAHALREAARAADPSDLPALRALRREALREGDWPRSAELLAAEARLAEGPERALLWTLLADIQLRALFDAQEARAALDLALREPEPPLTAQLLHAELAWLEGKPRAAAAALQRAASDLGRGSLYAALHAEAGRSHEAAGDCATAQACYAQAEAEMPPYDALLGLIRTARALGRLDEAERRLQQLCAGLGPGPLREAAASIPLDGRSRAVLGHAERSAERAHGTAQALAFLEEAVQAAGLGDAQAVARALSRAQAADPQLEPASWLTTLCAALPGVAELAAQGSAASHDLRRSAQLAAWITASHSDPLAEPAWWRSVDRAVTDADDDPTSRSRALALCCEIIAADAAARRGDGDQLEQGLEAALGRGRDAGQMGPVLAWLDYVAGGEASEEALALLDGLRAQHPGHPLPLRHRMRLTQDPDTLADLWREEAGAAPTPRATFALTQAGRLLEATSQQPAAAYRQALQQTPGHGPAAWALETWARRRGDTAALDAADMALAEHAADPTERAARRMRCANRQARTDPEAAVRLASGALALCPHDPLAHWRIATWTADRELRALHLADLANTTLGPLGALLRLRAALALEDAGRHAEALDRALLLIEALDAGTADATMQRLAPHVRFARDRLECHDPSHSGVAERFLAAVERAPDAATRVAALERLARFDAQVRKDDTSARLALQTLLESVPDHLPTLRSLQRAWTAPERRLDAAQVAAQLAEHIGAPSDAAAYLRLAVQLLELDGQDAGALLAAQRRLASQDLWLALATEGAGRARSDKQLTLHGLVAQHERLPPGAERASIAMRLTEATRALRNGEEAVAWLTQAVRDMPTHPIAAEDLGTLYELLHRPGDAAGAYLEAARATRVPAHALRLWYRAGELFADVEDLAQAEQAWMEAARIDVLHKDVFVRLEQLLRARGDTERSKELLRLRLRSGGETRRLASLHQELAALELEGGDRAAARQALEAAVQLEPSATAPLRELAQLCWTDGDWDAAADALIRWARVSQDAPSLREAFMQLGRLYETHAPDARRAEIAYGRVVQLYPDDRAAIDRLAAIYEAQAAHDKAARALARLVELAGDAHARVSHRLRLARAQEALGRPAEAEQTLEQARRDDPDDMQVVRALAGLLERQAPEGAPLHTQPALAVCWDRAIHDMERACMARPDVPETWVHLVECWRRRGHPKAAASCAAAAVALGHGDLALASLLHGGETLDPCGGRAFAESLLQIIAPPLLSPATRSTLAQLAGPLDRAWPFDVTAHGARRLRPDARFARALQPVLQGLGLQTAAIYVSDRYPHLLVPLSAGPPSLLLSDTLVSESDERELVALLWLGLGMAAAGLAPALRDGVEGTLLLMDVLRTLVDPEAKVPLESDPETRDQLARRLGKTLSRKQLQTLATPALEMFGAPGFSATALAEDLTLLGARATLLATGDAPATFRALARLAGERWEGDVTNRVAQMQRQRPLGDLCGLLASRSWLEALALATEGEG